MKVVVQRVKRASVTGKCNHDRDFLLLVGDKLVGAIGQGLCLLVGIGHDDTEVQLEEL